MEHAFGAYAYNDMGFWKWLLGHDHHCFGLNDYNPPAGPGAADSTMVRGVRESEVLIPSDMLAIADAPLMPSVPATTDQGDCTGQPDLVWFQYHTGIELDLGLNLPPGAVDDAQRELLLMRGRHGGRWNVVFCDAHAENLKTRQLFNPRDQSVLRRWNRDHQPHQDTSPWQ
jgi:prepilin-type processing-associated H-X9-DG protein